MDEQTNKAVNMDASVTRRELAETIRMVLAEEIEPFVNSKFAFSINVLRFMLAACGAMPRDEFGRIYEEYVDTFTQKFGDSAEEVQA